jgi:hypothetical protein
MVKANWSFVYKAEDFVYGSAANYCGEKGLFEIELIV